MLFKFPTIIAGIISLVLCGTTAAAQMCADYSYRGYVVDQSGRAIVNIQVVLLTESGKRAARTITNKDGFYNFENSGPDAQVRVLKQGFIESKRTFGCGDEFNFVKVLPEAKPLDCSKLPDQTVPLEVANYIFDSVKRGDDDSRICLSEAVDSGLDKDKKLWEWRMEYRRQIKGIYGKIRASKGIDELREDLRTNPPDVLASFFRDKANVYIIWLSQKGGKYYFVSLQSFWLRYYAEKKLVWRKSNNEQKSRKRRNTK